MEVTNATGRRKTAVARIYVQKGNGIVNVNKLDYKKYFPTKVLQYKIQQPLVITGTKDKFDISAHLDGGGVSGQAEALRLAISKALVKIDKDNRKELKANGLLTRDSRMVERKKPGQKKARKKFQFSKR
mgnify:CR=1 FL=1